MTEPVKRNKGGRPPGAKTRPPLERMERELDRQINIALRGKPAIDPASGLPITGPDGQPVLLSPAASILEVARKRVNDLARGRVKAAGDAMAAVRERLREVRAAAAGGEVVEDDDAPQPISMRSWGGG